MAGLLLLGPLLHAEGLTQTAAALSPTAQATEAIPARKPAPTATPIPSVKLEDLNAAEKRLEARIADAGMKNSDSYKKLEEADQALRRALELAKADLEDLTKKVDRLSKASDEAQPREDRQAKLLEAYSEILGTLKTDTAATLKKAEEARADIMRKGEKLEGLLDLMSTVKRDLNDNAHEIVELKQDIETLRKRLKAPEEEPEWYDRVARWPYLPATAALLGGLAIGIAATR